MKSDARKMQNVDWRMENYDNLPNPESADHIADESNHNSTSYTLHSQFINLLQTYWGYEDFRGIQWEIIESIASGHDTLGLMPTGLPHLPGTVQQKRRVGTGDNRSRKAQEGRSQEGKDPFHINRRVSGNSVRDGR